MNIMAVYHANRLSMFEGTEGLTTVRKGRHLMCGADVISEGEIMACAIGWLKNRSQLSRELGCYECAGLAEIAIAAYRRWGGEYAGHLEGPVATVIIDRGNERMLAVRDRMGERRLFYCRHGRTAAVSDHPDALAESPYASKVVDASGLNELFALGPARTPGKTPFRDIMELEPGCMLVAERGGVSVRRYYSMSACLCDDNAETAVKKVRRLLEDAVSDVMPMADSAMLSGGLDSTALVALMHAAGRRPRTYSVDYVGDETDFTGNDFQPERDREYAKLAAELYSAEHRNIILEHGGLYGELGTAMEARGFPGMADIDSSLLLFVQNLSGDSANIISGECGDEVFCGYPWFLRERIVDDKSFPWSGSMELRKSVLKRDISEIIKPERYAKEAFCNAMDTAPRVIGENAEDARLRTMQHLCFRFFMATLQERALCMCEMSAVNVYTPFCDYKLAEYVWNLPADIKFLNGETKGLLRAAVSDLLPEKLLRRKKSPYPKVYAPEYTQTVKKITGDMLEDSTSPILKVVDKKVIANMIASPLPAEGLPWFGQLMSGPQMLAYLWQVNQWMRTRNVEIVI